MANATVNEGVDFGVHKGVTLLSFSVLRRHKASWGIGHFTIMS